MKLVCAAHFVALLIRTGKKNCLAVCAGRIKDTGVVFDSTLGGLSYRDGGPGKHGAVFLAQPILVYRLEMSGSERQGSDLQNEQVFFPLNAWLFR